MALLEVNDLHVDVTTEYGTMPVIDGVTLAIDAGETVCLVGESGSGKSVTAMSLLRLNPEPQFGYPTGSIVFDGVDVLGMAPRQIQALRGDGIAMVFQDPTTSLNPSHRIGDQIAEIVRTHRKVSRRAALTRAAEVLADVGIPEPQRALDRYPHEFSGGMRQRALIAMSLACEPRMLIADEPTTALDVTTQARILEGLLRELRDRYDLALLLVTHDLGVVAEMADRVLVMYSGRIVESGPVRDVFYDPLMPYTDGLLNSRPATASAGALVPIPGSPPRIGQWATGCRFAPRCPYAMAACTVAQPDLRPAGQAHTRACVLEEQQIRELRLTNRGTQGVRLG